MGDFVTKSQDLKFQHFDQSKLIWASQKIHKNTSIVIHRMVFTIML